MIEKESIGTKFKSFIKGIAFIGGFLGPKNPYEGLSPKEADTRASRSDWEAVGGDLRTAINEFPQDITYEVTLPDGRVVTNPWGFDKPEDTTPIQDIIYDVTLEDGTKVTGPSRFPDNRNNT